MKNISSNHQEMQHFVLLICIHYIESFRKGDNTMTAKKTVSLLLAASICIGATACNKGEETSVRDKDIETAGMTVVLTTDKAEDGTDTKDTIASNDEKNSDATVNSDTALNAHSNEIIFKYTYGNMAWGYQSSVTYILANGDVYSFKNEIGTAYDANSDQIALSYLEEYAEPTGYVKESDVQQLAEICMKIDPDVKITEKNTANDMGQYILIYRNPETYEEKTIIKTGDWTMSTDDPTLKEAQELASKVINKISSSGLYLSLSSPVINVPCDKPELIGEHLVFDSYDSMIAFCKDNGIDVEDYLTDEIRNGWKDVSYMILQVFEDNRRVDGILKKDNKILRLLPSLAEYEYDPAFDGKMTVAIYRCDTFSQYKYVDENGNPWKFV